MINVGAGLVPAPELGAPVTDRATAESRAPARGAPTKLGDIIGAFKSLSTNAWAQCKFWQRNYYEHIIRNEQELFKIREYIESNPGMWPARHWLSPQATAGGERDRNNPKNF